MGRSRDLKFPASCNRRGAAIENALFWTREFRFTKQEDGNCIPWKCVFIGDHLLKQALLLH
jgi:hypothetical protein